MGGVDGGGSGVGSYMGGVDGGVRGRGHAWEELMEEEGGGVICGRS